VVLQNRTEHPIQILLFASSSRRPKLEPMPLPLGGGAAAAGARRRRAGSDGLPLLAAAASTLPSLAAAGRRGGGSGGRGGGGGDSGRGTSPTGASPPLPPPNAAAAAAAAAAARRPRRVSSAGTAPSSSSSSSSSSSLLSSAFSGGGGGPPALPQSAAASTSPSSSSPERLLRGAWEAAQQARSSARRAVSSARSRAAETLAAAQAQAGETLAAAQAQAGDALAHAGETLAHAGELAGESLAALRAELRRGAAVIVGRALAPEWLHLPGIETAYRVNHDSVWAAAKSVFALHADTVNIWSHLVTALYFVAAGARVRAQLERAGASAQDAAAFGLYLAFATLQMAMSVGYHTLRVVSPAHDETWLKLDLLGIAAQIVGAYVLGLREAFFCEPRVWAAYVGVMLLLIGGLVALPFFPRVQAKEWDALRNAAACAPVAFGLLPCAHWALAAAGSVRFSVVIVRAMLAIIAGYGGGFAVFFFGVPERFIARKGLFDLVGHSHQIWHLAVSAAGACWLEGMLEHAVWRNGLTEKVFCAA